MTAGRPAWRLAAPVASRLAAPAASLLSDEASRPARLANRLYDRLASPRCRYGIEAARRFATNPIITPALDPSVGANINGPSLIEAPDWLPGRLGRWHLYFAHHKGDHIRLAVADRLEGPWRLHPGGVLRLGDVPGFTDHIASPDVHVDHEARALRMYFHGVRANGGGQATALATSSDGLTFRSGGVPLGSFYFRVWDHRGERYALAKNGNAGWNEIWRRRRDDRGEDRFERGRDFLRRARHVAVLPVGDDLLIFYSRVGDRPERILMCTVDMRRPFDRWRPSAPTPVLSPRTDYEGVALPLRPSSHGAATQVRQLRDPFVVRDAEDLVLLYSVSGEAGLAGARLRCVPRPPG